MTVIYLAVIFFVAIDRFLKTLALKNYANNFNLLGDIFKFNFKENFYIAFSLPFTGLWLNSLISLIVVLLIYYLIKEWRSGREITAVCLFAVVAGASSNLYDRLSYGFVIDYLDLKYFTVFNLADFVIVVAVAAMLFFIKQKETVN